MQEIAPEGFIHIPSVTEAAETIVKSPNPARLAAAFGFSAKETLTRAIWKYAEDNGMAKKTSDADGRIIFSITDTTLGWKLYEAISILPPEQVKHDGQTSTEIFNEKGTLISVSKGIDTQGSSVVTLVSFPNTYFDNK